MRVILFIVLSLAVLAQSKPQVNKELLEKQLTKGFTDFLGNFVGQVVYPSVMNSLQGLAALAAQITAGVAIDGLPALQGLLGKRDLLQEQLQKGFTDFLGNFVGQVVYPSVMNSLQGLAALAAQITAGVAIDGLPALQGLLG